MNKYEVTDNQIKQSLIQMKDVYPLYQLQVVLGDDDVKTAPTWL
jgi:glutamyl/glutaminyl-tRNA synthetase